MTVLHHFNQYKIRRSERKVLSLTDFLILEVPFSFGVKPAISLVRSKLSQRPNPEHNCSLNIGSFSSLQNKIAQNRFWPVEIMRTPLQQVTKAKGKQASLEEDIPISFHGVAYVNMAPLLYPGVKRFVSVLV